MSGAVVLMERLDEVLPMMNLELSTAYTMKARGAWTWIERRGRYLMVDLLAAADFFDAAGKRYVAAALRQRAEIVHAEVLKQRALASRLREAVGQ
jgi:hypothetical protein